MPRMRMNQAIVTAIGDEMRTDPTVIMFGEDIAMAGGPFKTSEGLQAEFGPERVRDTPISEMAFTGAGVGAAAMGMRPVVEIMFMEFLGVALDQLVTQGAKYRYLSKGTLSVPLTVRASVGTGAGFGTQHSQTLENWVTASPGLTVVSPSDPQSAYGLLRAAIQHPDPVIVLEPRALYGTRGPVETGAEHVLALGRARAVREGTDATLVCLGRSTSVALQAAEMLAGHGHDVEVLDLLTLVPWDVHAVRSSVARTGRLIVVEDSPLTGGWGGDVVSRIASESFTDLSAPPFRICSPDVPVPYGKELEERYAPQAEEVATQVVAHLRSDTVPEPWWVREGLELT